MRREDFDTVITSGKERYRSSRRELWAYRDLVLLLVRRDFVSGYKQTVLGPAWAVVQPLVSTLMTALVFGGLAGLSPDGIPVFLFYMSGQVIWAFIEGCVRTVSGTFVNNIDLMGKVWFPRLAVPIAGCFSQLIAFAIQAVLFALFYAGYVISGAPVRPDITLLLMPLYILQLMILALGCGAILSAMTTKYRDTVFLITYVLTFWMYISPVVYDTGLVPEKYMTLYMINPVSPVITNIRYALFGQGKFYYGYWLMSICITLALFLLGFRVFDRVQRNFIDTI